MKINGPLYDAIFVKRLNRFLTLIDVDGKFLKAIFLILDALMSY